MNDDDFRWLVRKLAETETRLRVSTAAPAGTLENETNKTLSRWRQDADTPPGIKAAIKLPPAIP